MTLTDLDTFTGAYVNCALWTETDGDSDQSLRDTYTPNDIAPESLETIRAECAAFLAENARDIGCACNPAGRDFWLTRNGHGAGFWDGDWPESAGERLTQAAKAAGARCLYLGDDGQLHYGPG